MKESDMKGVLGNALKQAQRLQEEMAKLECTGESGAGLVKVVVNGRHDVKSVKIAPELLGEDVAMLEDLLAAAVNDANRKLEQRTAEKMGGLGQMLNLPPGMKLPF
jgi:hypothetical protein